MKTTKFLQTLSLLLILVIAISCRSSRYSTGGQYPTNPSPQTETTTNTYSVQSNSGNLPPGQAKKIYGDQSAKAYAPGQRKKYPLVIVYTNDIVINRYSDGRYYYRNAAGYNYWKGDDGRYYLDERHLKDAEYEESEYDDWKFKGQKNYKAQGPKEKDQYNQKEKDNGQKEKDQSAPKAKDENPKEKDQADQKVKDNDQKGKDQIDQKAKDDNPLKGKAKSKDKA